MDDERLERGTQISSELTKAIEESRFSIVIFSKNYASSTWCLEELAKIVEFMETNNNHTVIPVFYNVEPSDVRKQKGEFKKAFDKHQQNPKIDSDKIQRWRAALERAANTVGDFISAGRPEAKLVEDIVKDICGRLHISSFDGDQSKYVVGMDYHWEKMNALLQVGSDDVRFIGICGMGGIGKTTIARYVYEKLSYQYEVSCFLGDVRQEYESNGGRVVALQEQLLSKVMKQTNLRISNVYEGINSIRRWLGNKKVLVVLDDVDDQIKQLKKLAGSHDWFGPKSRIIVTTRDEQVLKSHAITCIYKVNLLNGDDALQLFRMNAFKNEHPTDDHVNLSSDIVNYASGIPLALEVLGSHLCDTIVEHWKSTLDSLKDYPDGKILKVLRISYDHGLKQSERDIFLNIACFFKGKNKDRVMKILDSCDLYSASGIKILVDKSLITISADNKLGMHGLLQEMGWEIVREKYPNVCGKWSRLWLFKDVQHVLTCNMDFPKLKTIKLSNSHNLIETPDFTMVPNLEMLDLKGCTRLRKVHESVGILKSLIVLNLEGCNSLQSFPRNVLSGMKSLKILKLQGCSKLDKFPENLEELEHLEELDVGETAIRQVPSSIARLTNLQKLSFQNCNSQPWWSSYLLRTNTRCLALPSLAGLRSLKTLNLSECNLLEGTLPKDLDSLCSLEQLNLSKNKFISLPESIKQLSELKILCLEHCEQLRSLPELPSNIVFVVAEGCHSLEDVSLRGCTSPAIALHLFNCPKLIQNRGHQEINLAVMLLKQRLQQWGCRLSHQCHISIPGNEIPEWFSCKSDHYSVKIGLPSNWLNDEFMGIAMCGVFTLDHKDLDGSKIGVKCSMDIIGNSYTIYFPLHIFTTSESDHLLLAYVSREQFEHDRSLTLKSTRLFSLLDRWEYEYDSTNSVLVSTSTCIHARFEVIGGGDLNYKAIKSGIRPVYKRDIECYDDDLPATDGSKSHQHHNCSTFAGNRRRFNIPEKLQVSYFRLDNNYRRLILG
ncbi:hypothetical protein Dsin_003585 [Dipteronia sinensis]|uniref:ADP-ribosyl cyclase/cyclic ADP-ribose hydrolase n=1 Tax=Dipteronia sinensis TaxID=43782 RepID=A0AAE0B983_9ROSI|nr:hypothetical protein Dsin_003585 [Dipteronia sinensis]